jgi:hypothetical protein
MDYAYLAEMCGYFEIPVKFTPEETALLGDYLKWKQTYEEDRVLRKAIEETMNRPIRRRHPRVDQVIPMDPTITASAPTAASDLLRHAQIAAHETIRPRSPLARISCNGPETSIQSEHEDAKHKDRTLRRNFSADNLREYDPESIN